MVRPRNAQADESTTITPADVAAPEQRAADNAAKNGDKPKEAKDARFLRLAPKRVNNAIKRLRHVAALANRATYDYTDEQRDKIIAAIEAEVKHLKEAYAGVKNGKGGFSF